MPAPGLHFQWSVRMLTSVRSRSKLLFHLPVAVTLRANVLTRLCRLVACFLQACCSIHATMLQLCKVGTVFGRVLAHCTEADS